MDRDCFCYMYEIETGYKTENSCKKGSRRQENKMYATKKPLLYNGSPNSRDLQKLASKKQVHRAGKPHPSTGFDKWICQ